MFIQSPYKAGGLFGFWCAFPKRGDGIPMHEHDSATVHNTVVLRGSVVVYGEKGPDQGWRRVLGVGDIFDFDVSQPHEIAALEDNTLVLNLMLHGMPAGYEKLPESELQSVTRRPLQFPVEGA